jgi:hypothetical protein
LGPDRRGVGTDTQIGDRRGDCVESRPGKTRQAGERTEGGKVGLVLPSIENLADTRLLLDHWLQIAGARHRDVGTERCRPGDVARELDAVAKALIGDQQQRRARRQLVAVPLRAIGWRHQRGGAGEAETPLVLLPTALEIAAQQWCLGNTEMRAWQIAVEREGLFGAGDRGIQLEAVVMKDT